MAITTTTVIADTVPTIIEEARFTEQFEARMRGLVDVHQKKLHEGSTVNLPYWGIATASALTEGVDMASPTSMADTNVPFTPAEVGCQIIVTDKVVRDNQEDVKRAAGRILGNAMATKMDVDILTQIDDGTTSLGGSTTTMTLGHWAAAHALLGGLAVASGGPAPKPWYGVHHPYCLLDLVDVMTPLLATAAAGTPATAGSVADAVLRNYGVGKLFGVPIIEDGNFTIASTAVKGGMFSKMGLVLAVAKEWDVEVERDASLRASELNIVGEYATGEYLAGWIVEIHADAATPA